MPATRDGARFVGRDAAFIRLAPALEAAAGGESTAVLLDGPGGVGVTRFLDEVARRVGALSEPFAVVRGRAFRPGADEPYGPIVRALRPVLRETPDDALVGLVGPVVEDVVHLFPDIQARLGVAGALPDRPTITAPERRQGRVLEAILGVIGRLSERQPVLLILEDLHDADAGTRALVTFLSRVRRHHRVTFVGTYASDELTRDHPLSPTLADLSAAGASGPARIRIEPFDRSELADLVQAIEGERPTGSALVLVADRSRGLPLVAEELLAARREVSDASLTGSFDDLVIARLARRGPEARRVIRLLAPSGRPVARDELAETAAAFELTADRLPPRSSTRPRRGEGALDPDLSAGLDEAIEHGILVDEGSRSATSTSGAPRRPTCSRGFAAAIIWRSPPASSRIPARPPTTGSRLTSRIEPSPPPSTPPAVPKRPTLRRTPWRRSSWPSPCSSRGLPRTPEPRLRRGPRPRPPRATTSRRRFICGPRRPPSRLVDQPVPSPTWTRSSIASTSAGTASSSG